MPVPDLLKGMGGTELALRQAVIADPENDLPRLVLADFLEEDGKPEYAEFIRISCELENMEKERSEDDESEEAGRQWRARSRQESLWAICVRGKLEAETAVLDLSVFSLHLSSRSSGFVKRGMVERVTVAMDAILDGHYDRLFLTQPIHKIVTNASTMESSNPSSGYPVAYMSEVGCDDQMWAAGVAGFLPECIARNLSGDPNCRTITRPEFGRDRCRTEYRFPSHAAALSALGTACVKYGRYRARRILEGKKP